MIFFKKIANEIQKIEDLLHKEDDIPVKIYAALNHRLIVFKENLLYRQSA